MPEIAIQGEAGSFSDQAARKLLGEDVKLLPCRTFDEVFDAVSSGAAGAAVVPIENTLAGSVLRTYELLSTGDVRIIGELLLPITLNVIARPGVKFEQIRKVLSHPVAIAQCHKFLASQPEIEAIATYDTAGSVRMIMDSGDDTQAAIAGDAAAGIYGAHVILANIQDNEENFTRFILVHRRGATFTKPHAAPSASTKTTILFRTPNKPGALFRALACFALRDINLTKLESRPIAGRPWEYMFYADIGGHESDRNITNALGHLREMCDTMIVLGSYPVAGEGDG